MSRRSNDDELGSIGFELENDLWNDRNRWTGIQKSQLPGAVEGAGEGAQAEAPSRTE